MECARYITARTTLFKEIIENWGDFRGYNEEEKFVTIMKLEDERVIDVAVKYFKTIISIRGEF